jgi:hypothetical protein
MYRTHEPRLPHHSAQNSLVGGAILVGLGLMFLYQNFTGWMPGNWWALFILIPATAALNQARLLYQQSGTLTPAMRGPLTGGLVMLFVASVFLFGLSWTLFWPAVLVVVGLGMLLMPAEK